MARWGLRVRLFAAACVRPGTAKPSSSWIISIVVYFADFHPSARTRTDHQLAHHMNRRLPSTLRHNWHQRLIPRRKHRRTSFRSSRLASASIFRSRSSRMAVAWAASFSCPPPEPPLGPGSALSANFARMLSFLYQSRFIAHGVL